MCHECVCTLMSACCGVHWSKQSTYTTTCTHMRANTLVRNNMHSHACRHTRTQQHAFTCVQTHSYTSTCTRMCTKTLVHSMHSHACKHTRTQQHALTCVKAHSYTQRHSPVRSTCTNLALLCISRSLLQKTFSTITHVSLG